MVLNINDRNVTDIIRSTPMTTFVIGSLKNHEHSEGTKCI